MGEKLPGSTEKGQPFYVGSRVSQYYSAFVVNLSVLSVGTIISWTSTAIPDLRKDVTFPALSSAEEGWVTSAFSLGGLAVCPLGGYLIQKLGLRRSMVTLTLPLIAGWLLIAFSKNFWTLLFGRIITGFSAGGMSLATPVFIAETSDVQIRGMLGYTFDIMCALGELFIFVVGSFLSWRWQAVSCGIIPIIFYLLMFVIPESPAVLISKNQIEEAKKSLAWFRGAPSTSCVEEEFASILEDADASHSKNSLPLREYFSRPIFMPTLICVILMLFYNITGSSPLLAYTVQIFSDVNVRNSFLATILTGVTQVVVASTSALFVDRVGRRVLLILSGVGMALSMIGLGAYLHFKAEIGAGYNWLPIPIVMIYIVVFSIGFGPIPWVVMGELIPTRAKGYASAVVLASYRFSAFVSLFSFNHLVISFGQDICFILFGVIAVLASFYVYFFVPETMKKTLQEIQANFERKPASPPEGSPQT